MKRSDLSHLEPNEQRAIAAYVERLTHEADGQILLVALFGSKARGEGGSDSDVDILIITSADPRELDRRILELRQQADLPEDLFFNEFILGRERWANFAHRRAAMWQNVQRDGITLIKAPDLPDELAIRPDFEEGAIMADYRPEIGNYIKLAHGALRSAENSMVMDDFRTVANRAYYAVFYAANAMLATEGLQRSKHSGVMASFRERFVKTGKIEKVYSVWYEGTFKKRDISDYDEEAIVDESFVVDSLDQAHRFVGRIERYMTEPGFL